MLLRDFFYSSVPHILCLVNSKVFDFSTDETKSPSLTITPTFPATNLMAWKDGLAIIVCGGDLSVEGKIPCQRWRIGSQSTVEVEPKPFGMFGLYENGRVWVGDRSKINLLTNHQFCVLHKFLPQLLKSIGWCQPRARRNSTPTSLSTLANTRAL